MLAQWTGEIIGKMHVYSITSLELASKLGWHPKYLSAVLNCKRGGKNAEGKVRCALSELITDRELLREDEESGNERI